MGSAYRRATRAAGLLLCLLLLLQAKPVLAFDALRWTWIDPQPTGAALFGVAYGNGLFVAVGEAETILTSPDGVRWTVRRTNYSTNTFDIIDVIWGGGQFVALARVEGTVQNHKGITESVERYMPLTSPDGITWTVHRDQAGFAVSPPVAIGDFLYAQLGYDGARYVLHVTEDPEQFFVSEDGVHWRSAPNYKPEDFPGYHPTAPGPFARGNGLWVSFGKGRVGYYDGPVGFWTSRDGVRWDYRLPHEGLTDVAFGNGLFVAVGTTGWEDRRGFIVTSADGVNWTPHGTSLSEPGDTLYSSAAYGNGVTVIGGEKKVVVLDAALRPTVVPLPEHVVDVAFVKGQFVLIGHLVNQIGSCYGGKIYTSPDGREWTLRQETGACADRIIEAGDQVVVWTRDYLWFSGDLVNWERRAHGIAGGVSRRGMAWGDGKFIMLNVADRSNILYISEDGINWTQHNPRLEYDDFATLNYANGLFFMSGLEDLYVSRDGLSWIRHDASDSLQIIRNVYYLDGQYVGVGGRNLIFSADGENWRTERALGRAYLTDIVSTGTHWILVGDNRILAAEIPPCRPYFTDIPTSHPVCKAAETLYRYGVTTGYADGSFRPDNRVTRAEIAKMVTVALRQPPYPIGRLSFQDVSGHWAYTQGYLQTAVELGIISGYSPQRFGPDDPLTRAQLIKIAAAALGLTDSGKSSYTGVPAWAEGWVAAAERAGLIGSKAPHPIWTGGDLNGDAPVTRAEAAILLANLLELKK